MRIGVSLDGVLADYDAGWRRAYATWYGQEIREPTKTSNDAVSLTRFPTWDEFDAWLADVPGFWAGLDPVPGALGALRELRRSGHEVVFITARPGWARHETDGWLRAHGLKTSAHFAPQKVAVSAQLYIDAGPEALRGLAAAGAPYVIRFVHPWNADCPGSPANGWDEVLEAIESARKPA